MGMRGARALLVACVVASTGLVGAGSAWAGPKGGGTAAATGAIAGSVRDPDGIVAGGASVTVYTSSFAIAARTTTNAAGGFSVSGLPAGTYMVQTNRVVMFPVLRIEQGNAFNVAVAGGGTTSVSIQMFEIPINVDPAPGDDTM